MPRLAVLCAFAVLLLVGGVLAGQAVHSSLAATKPRQALAMDTDAWSVDFNQTKFREPLPFANCPEPFATVMHNDSSDSSAVTLVSQTKGSVTPSEDRAHGSPPDNGVLLLIQRTFPDADPETARIWAESYSEMDLSEVEFILEQKRRLSGSLDAGLSATPEMALPSGGSEHASEDSRSLRAAIRLVSRNLSGSWTVGFRGTVVLPEAASDLARNEDQNGQQAFRALMFYSFDPGKRISSPLPLHVTLPADNGALMFCLEGNRLTRRGDFQLLADRRVGLTTHTGPVPLLDSAILPESAKDVSISQAGEIQYVDPAGMTLIAGRVAVTRVVDLSELSSDDGVIFVTRSSESLSTPEPDKIRLSTGTLELSNVDRENERALLSHLQSLRPDLFDDSGFR